MQLSIVIPTYGREQVLLNTLAHCLALTPSPDEILVMDQTPAHQEATEAQLHRWARDGQIQWRRLPEPSIVAAMNEGLKQAKGDVVLFLDDDIIPCSTLVIRHIHAHQVYPEAWAVVGQVLQPGQEPVTIANPMPSLTDRLTETLKHRFDSSLPGFTLNVMAGNLSVNRAKALVIGGFDPKFIGVAYRFESDFGRRIWQAGGKVWFEPSASIRHLRVPSGGTRKFGSHLTSASPVHGVGDYYFAQKHARGVEMWWYILKRPFREVCTKFHLQNPWYIPVKFIGELRACLLAGQLKRQSLQVESIKASNSV